MCEIKTFSKETFKQKELFFIRNKIDRKNFVPWLRENYNCLRCFHSTRTKDVSSFYKNGFVPTDMGKATLYFKELLNNIGYEEEYDIQETIDLFTGDSDRRIYFCLNREGFLKRSPHYLIYGSELILCFAQHVSQHIKYELKKIGLPTIFHCDVPLSNFDDEELITLHDKICSATGRHNEKLTEIFSDYSVVVEGHVSGDCIIHHDHPTEELPDYHCRGYYKNDIATCPHCSK